MNFLSHDQWLHVFTVVKFFLGNIRGGSTVARTGGRGEKPDKTKHKKQDIGGSRGQKGHGPSSFYFI